MITERDLQEAIAECEGQRNPTSNTCIKLAAFYTIRDNLYPKQNTDDNEVVPPSSPPQIRESRESRAATVSTYDGDSDFARLAYGLDIDDLMPIMDELMQTLQIIQPRLYDGVMRKLNNI